MERRPGGGSLITFLTVEETLKKDGYIAAAMTTDMRGYPLEFKATTPIRPTLVQRTLYGRQLEHYVGVELCGKTLLNQLSRRPRLVIVPFRRLLSLSDELSCDVVAVRLPGDAVAIEQEANGRVAQGTLEPGSFKALVYEARLSGGDGKELLSLLQEVASNFDLLEAFDRVRAALQLLAKEDPRYA